MKTCKLNQKAQQVLTFRKWGRKNYSVYQTIHQVVRIAVLTVIYFLFSPIVSFAIEKDTSEVNLQYDLDEIEVSAQRSPAVYSQVARILSVIERKEIEASPSQSIQELLEYVVGIDVRQRGAEGVQADVGVRGGTFDQTLILLNGINITDPQTGHHNLNLPLSLHQIERIEVLEGPAARVYGPNAFSGAINIITRQPESKSLNLSISAGSYSYFDSNLSASFNIGKSQNVVAGSRSSSNGYTDNTDFLNSTLYYSNQTSGKTGKFNFQVGSAHKGFGANSFYTPKYPNQYEFTKTLFTSAKWESNKKLHLSPVIYFRKNQDRFELFRDTPASWYKSHNYHLTNVYGANLNSWLNWKAGKTAFGVEFRSENIISNVLGEELETPQKVPGEDAVFTKSKSRNTYSAFAEHAAYFNNFVVTLGVLSNRISETDLNWNFFPGIDIGYTLNEYFKLFSSYNTSLRMPTFTDLYYSGPTNIGNVNLKPEKSATLEGGLKFSGKLIQGHVVIFYREGRDIIDWIKLENDALWQPLNLTRLNNFGSEINFQFYLREKFGKSFPDKIQLSYLNNKLRKEKANLISNYVLDNLKHKFVAKIQQKITPALDVMLVFNFQDREGAFTSFENGNWANEVEYVPFCLFDTKMNYNLKKVNFFISASNLFNKRYFDIGNVVQPGRWIKSGISIKI